MEKTLLELLRKIAGEIYSEEQTAFSEKVYTELASLKLDDKSLAVGYLIKADIKNPVIKKLITDNFGAVATGKLELLERISNVNFPESSKLVSDLRKLFIKLTDDITVIIIKLAERLCTIRSLEGNTDEQKRKIAGECLYLYSPIAHRLGIRRIYTDMEDLSFKILFPEDFRRLSRLIEKKRVDYERKLAVMGNELKKAAAGQGIEFKLQSRVKRLYSIFRKIKSKNIDIDEIFDLLALRVITNSPENCYQVLGAVHSNWIPIEGRFRDWITFPKPNGYRSIQTTVLTRGGDKYEIQIRTEEMHHEAEYGTSAHWAYKEGVSSYDTGIMQLKEFLENDEYFDNPYELLDKLKNEIKSDYIHVLTPKGDIKPLPVNSTPVDYAFTIHTDLGYQVTGARVNGKFVKVNTVLKSGDVIDIVSNKNSKPSRDWLNFVATSRARSKILRWFKNNERIQLIADGRQSYEIVKKRYKRELAGKADELSLRRYCEKAGYAAVEDFYYAISTGGVKPSRNLLAKIYPEAFQKDKKKAAAGQGAAISHKLEPQIRVEGLQDIETILAKCCNPIKGEEIVAYITSKSKLKIHRGDCPLITKQALPQENLKKAEWVMKDSLQNVRIRLAGENYPKMLRELADVAEQLKIGLFSTEQTATKSKSAVVTAEIRISDISQLDKLRLKLVKSGNIESMKVL